MLALFRMTMLQQSPVVGELTKSDFVYFLLVSLSLLILIFQAYLAIEIKKVSKYTQEIQDQRIRNLEKFNNLLFLVIILLLIIFITYNSLIA